MISWKMKNAIRYLSLFIMIAIFEASAAFTWYNKLFWIPVILSGAVILSFIYVNADLILEDMKGW